MVNNFPTFWQIYPRKCSKKDAMKAWSKLKPAEQVKALEALPNHIKNWSGNALMFIPYPATWIRGERWEDELQPIKTSLQTSTPLTRYVPPPIVPDSPELAAKRAEARRTVSNRLYPEFPQYFDARMK